MKVSMQCLALTCQVEIIAVHRSLVVCLSCRQSTIKISETDLLIVRWPLGIFRNEVPLVLGFSSFLHARRTDLYFCPSTQAHEMKQNTW